jgi:hypothetical protein
MDYQLFKLDPEKLNSISRYRLLVVSESIDVVFTYKTFREVLEPFAFFTSGRIGYVVKLLAHLYPYERPALDQTFEDKYPDKVLKEYVEHHGIKVFRRESYSLCEALVSLKKRGYSFFPEVLPEMNNVVSIFRKPVLQVESE